ncbi:MAG: acyl-CoA thioesterase II [Actinomycetota bacterium]|nr:acyl-CoA thioesterase II [Actinomycetota bacterium]
MTQAVVDDLIRLLDLEPIERNIFRGQSPDERRQRVFGGQVAGQALVAAYRTVESGTAHSLHAYFLRPGDPTIPILYEVERIRDGRSFRTRRVVAIQHGQAIFHLSASFHEVEDGLEHQIAPPENIPAPDTLPDFATRNAVLAEKLGDWYTQPRPIDARYVGPNPLAKDGAALAPEQYVWMRADGDLPDNPVLHQCVLTYASDMSLLDTVTRPHGVSFVEGEVMMASLDHAMWFHRPFRSDRWFLYAQDTPAASGSRGLARGLIYQDGRLVVSVVQEGLVRRL